MDQDLESYIKEVEKALAILKANEYQIEDMEVKLRELMVDNVYTKLHGVRTKIYRMVED